MGRRGVRIRSIAIGGRDEDGRQRYATPLELQDDIQALRAETVFIDWTAIANVAGLSRLERNVFLSRQVGRETAVELGITRAQLAAANRHIARKLQKCRDVIRPYIQELTPEELSCEKKWLNSRNQQNLTHLIEGEQMKLEEMEARLRDEQAKLTRLNDRAETARVAFQEADADLGRLEKQVESGRISAELAEKSWPDDVHKRKLVDLQGKATEAEKNWTIKKAAVQEQREIIGRIRNEISGQNLNMFLAAVEVPRLRFLNAETLDELMESALQLQALGARYSLDLYTFTEKLFPWAGGRAALDNLGERMELITRFNSALRNAQMMQRIAA